jgi:predicted secreted hydrolase
MTDSRLPSRPDHRRQKIVCLRPSPWLPFAKTLLLCIAAIALMSAHVKAQFATPEAGDAPIPIEFPRDDGPHSSSIEWWYFTGHLDTDSSKRYGFEYVVFRARPRGLEGYVSHFAITDHSRGEFRYAQRIMGPSNVIGSDHALDLALDGWTMLGGAGVFSLHAEMPGYDLNVELESTKPAALHDGDGYIDYGNGTASYYYSWTRLAVRGTIDTGAGPESITGLAWMDHQWGDFETYQNGGWDWFAIQLDSGTDIMLYLIRSPDGEELRVDGSVVDPAGAVTTLGSGDFAISATAEWVSPRTGTTYPSGWEIEVPDQNLQLTVTPVQLDQELDTRPTTGVIYWEGESLVSGTQHSEPIRGRGYVELTGYAPFEPLGLPSEATPAS